MVKPTRANETRPKELNGPFAAEKRRIRLGARLNLFAMSDLIKVCWDVCLCAGAALSTQASEIRKIKDGISFRSASFVIGQWVAWPFTSRVILLSRLLASLQWSVDVDPPHKGQRREAEAPAPEQWQYCGRNFLKHSMRPSFVLAHLS